MFGAPAGGQFLRLFNPFITFGPAFEGAQITHGQRAAPGAIERVRIDAATLEPSWKVIGFEDWIRPGEESPDSARATGI